MNQALNVSFGRRGMNAEIDQISSCPQELYIHLQHRERGVCPYNKLKGTGGLDFVLSIKV